MTKTNEISYFHTDTTHKHRLHIVQLERAWLCYWVSEYSFRYKPWFFVEVDGQRDLQKNNWIYMLVCFWNLQEQYQTHLVSLSIATGYQTASFDALPMHLLYVLVVLSLCWYSGSPPLQSQRRPSRSIQLPNESPRLTVRPRNFSPLSCRISNLSEDDVQQQWLGGHYPYLPSYW